MPSDTHGVRCPIIMPRGIAERGDDARLLVRNLYLADIRWKLGERGPQEFDCYSTTQLVQWHLFGRPMMDVRLGPDACRRDIVMAMRHHDALAQWMPIEGRGGHGDAVHMAHRDDPWHIGTFLALDRGVIVHCSERQGLRADPVTDLIATGWKELQFYRFEGNLR